MMAPTSTLDDDDQLTEVFSALASPVRRQLLARLAEGAATVNELAEPFDLQLPAVSKHLKVLQHAGLIVRAKHAQYRPCAIDATPIREVLAWAEGYRPVWESRLDRMEHQLAHFLDQENDDDA